MAKPGRKPWIKDPAEDGGEDLRAKLAQIAEIASITDEDQDIYSELGISHNTWYEYKARYPEIDEVKFRAWRKTLTRVKNQVFKKALDGDFQAQKFILERKSGWIETQQHQLTGANGGPIEVRARRYALLNLLGTEEGQKALELVSTKLIGSSNQSIPGEGPVESSPAYDGSEDPE